MTPELKEGFGKVIDEVMADALKKANEPEKEHIERVVEDARADRQGRRTRRRRGALRPGREGPAHAPRRARGEGRQGDREARPGLRRRSPAGTSDITFDVEKIGDFTLHKVGASPTCPRRSRRSSGRRRSGSRSRTAHVAFSIEPDGTAIRAGLKAKPAPVPVLSAEVSLAKLLPLVAKRHEAGRRRRRCSRTRSATAVPAGRTR